MTVSPTVTEGVAWAASRLAEAVDSPEAEAITLMQEVLGCSRSDLVLRGREAIGEVQRRMLEEMVNRRRGSEPLQYVTGRQGFRGIDLAVGPGVLVPRPETELVVEQALHRIHSIAEPKVVEIGAGSGAISLSLALEHPGAKVWATELSPQAMAWAERNRRRCGAKVELLLGDMFSPLPPDLRGAVDLVVSNPPYLSESDLAVAPADVSRHEPHQALVAGPTGLEVASTLAAQALDWLAPGGWLVLETSPLSSARLRTLLAANYAQVSIFPDLNSLDRIAEGRRR